MKKYNQYYEKKIELCNKLVNSKKKKIKEADVIKAAKEIGLPYPAASRAWKNFVENSGNIDKRSTKGNKSSVKICKNTFKSSSKPYTKSRNIDAKEAAKILLEFMEKGNSTTKLSNKYNVSIHQIYGWLNELQVSGRLLGNKVLNPEKYSKPEILTVIAYHKNPYSNSKRIQNLTESKKLNYQRVADILVDYLTAIMNK